MFDFVAIDFETATGYSDSACSIGIIAVEGLKIVEKKGYLIQPPDNEYWGRNIAIHKITPDQTRHAPTLNELWPEIEHFFNEHIPVVAHNAPFDMTVLRASTNADIPDFVFVDSMDIAAAFTDRRKLLECAEDMGIELEEDKHHDALFDAEVCATIAGIGVRAHKCLSMWEYIAKYGYGRRFSDIKPKKSHTEKQKHHYETARPKDVVCTVDNLSDKSPLYGKNIVFTGTLSFERREAMQMAVNAGAIVRGSVSKKTDYLVVGKQDTELVGDDGMSGKEEKAYALNEAGIALIKIIGESDFLRLIHMEEKDGSNVVL